MQSLPDGVAGPEPDPVGDGAVLPGLLGQDLLDLGSLVGRLQIRRENAEDIAVSSCRITYKCRNGRIPRGRFGNRAETWLCARETGTHGTNAEPGAHGSPKEADELKIRNVSHPKNEKSPMALGHKGREHRRRAAASSERAHGQTCCKKPRRRDRRLVADICRSRATGEWG